METLGEDLILLLIEPRDGLIANTRQVPFGLAGSELVRLAARGRISIVSGQIVVLHPTPTGDPQLDLALHSIIATKIKPLASTWVSSPRPNIRREYLDRLVAAGAVHGQPHERSFVFQMNRWTVIDPGRLASVRQRLDGIAQSDGPLSQEDLAFGGLAFAVGLDRYFYPGWSGRKPRKRLAKIAAGDVAATAASQAARAAQPGRPASEPGPEIPPLVEAGPRVPGAGPGPHHGQPQPAQPGAAAQAVTGAVTGAVIGAAAGAATDAAVQAATQAATHAATHAAVQAATHAAVSAAHHAAGVASGGHGGGGHSGHSGGGGGDHGGGGGHHH
jgi:hypothetical protein